MNCFAHSLINHIITRSSSRRRHSCTRRLSGYCTILAIDLVVSTEFTRLGAEFGADITRIEAVLAETICSPFGTAETSGIGKSVRDRVMRKLCVKDLEKRQHTFHWYLHNLQRLHPKIRRKYRKSTRNTTETSWHSFYQFINDTKMFEMTERVYSSNVLLNDSIIRWGAFFEGNW